MGGLDSSDRALLDEAARAREGAYAPYSGFAVGAALLSADGRMHSGVNVENASLGLSICAERNAVARAVADGARDFRAIAIVGGTGEPVAPCGACRQVLHEFAPRLRIILASPSGQTKLLALDELLAHPFGDFRVTEGS